MYVGFECSPPRSNPVEIDVLVVMDDRVLLLELKNFNGDLAANGDQWRHGERVFRSPVQDLNGKARKVATLLMQSLQGWNATYRVDARVVLCGKATKSKLARVEQEFVLSLAEARSLGSAAGRSRHLPRAKLPAKKPCQFEAEFDRVTRNPKLFRPKERQWEGYRATDEDVVAHPRDLWREHLGELVKDPRQKALIRVWAFNRLGAKLNSQEMRRFIAERELRAIGRLEAMSSRLLPAGVLMPLPTGVDEYLTQHFDLRRLPPGWVTLDRFLEREAETLGAEDRKIAAATLVNAVAELHAQGIAHRDLGPRCIWVGGETRQALTGFMACQMPEEASVSDWLATLQAHAPAVETAAPGKIRDVRALGRLVLQIFGGDLTAGLEAGLNSIGPAYDHLRPWLERSLAEADADTYPDAVAAAADFGAALDQEARPTVDQVLLDRHETDLVPYVEWPLRELLQKTSAKHVYRSAANLEGDDAVIVKIWFNWKRGTLADELALMRLFRGVARIQESQRADLPRYLACGLSHLGAFVTYAAVCGGAWTQPCDTFLSALLRSAALLRAIDALHAMDLDHGDLSPANVIVQDGDEIVLVDLFDHSSVGDGRVFAAGYRPDNAEALSAQEIDRFGALALIEGCLSPWRGAGAVEILTLLAAERTRSRIETLEPVAIAIGHAITVLQRPMTLRFPVHAPGVAPGALALEDEPLFGRAFENGSGIEYLVTGPDRELALTVTKSGNVSLRSQATSFASLQNASLHGVRLELAVDLEPDPRATPDALLTVLKEAVTVVPEVGRDKGRRIQASNLDVPAYWRRLLALEEGLQPVVMITAELILADAIGAYAYERLGVDFDFDPDDQVEVRLPSGAKLGELDLNQTDGRVLTVRLAPHRTLRAGDRVVLIDRRTRTSFDRREKAVDRVLRREAAIPDLIDYFSSGRSRIAADYGILVSDEELAPYRLNEGQKEAFKHVARYGPLALQQGPPGTGKTRFIAAFVHWLITRHGATRILLASQSHEAVNNAIEALVDLYKELGGQRPSLLRIGSKGITEKIRPFHTKALRERYQVKFEAAFRHRVANISSAMGLRRAFAQDAADLDRSVGEPARRVMSLEALRDDPRRRVNARDRLKDAETLGTAMTALRAAASAALGEECPEIAAGEILDLVFDDLRGRYPGVSDGDVRKVRQVLGIARDWSASLASSHRNFEEFLAKTRTVVAATCVGVGQTKIRIDSRTFDWVIIDEAARCTSSELAVPIQVGQRILLVGDHLQLKPMIDSEVLRELKAEMPAIPPTDLARSDFERAFTSPYGHANGKRFEEQYRMAPAICDLVSTIFYRPHAVLLGTSTKREGNQAFDALPVPLDQPVVWLDTSGSPQVAEQRADWNPHTFWNPAEIDAALAVLDRIAREERLVSNLAAGPEETPIGVICMYAGQKAALDEAFSERPWDSRFRRLVRIDTVDSYQGKENAIVIMSLVRSNEVGVRGHVNSFNRCNVALSRAKERLFILGDRTMWKASPEDEPMRQVLDYIEAKPAGTALLQPRHFQ